MVNFYEHLIREMPLAYARHRMVYDSNGVAIDYVFLDVNSKFEQITGLISTDLIGNRLTQTIPETMNDHTDWIATYATVVRTNKTLTFTSYVASFDTHYQITAFKTDIDEFVTIFEDVSIHVHNTENLIEANNSLKEHNEQLYEKSVTDSLTRFFNHNYIREVLGEELRRSSRTDMPLAIAMIDIDHFKQINDSFGHLTGDDVLTMFSDLLRKQTRKSDMVGRYGGEEFLLVLPSTDIKEANQIVDRLRCAVANHIFMIHSHTISLTVSCGISSYHGQSMHQLIEEADTHLYEAKRLGRNQCKCKLLG